jgi:hypothetical protein
MTSMDDIRRIQRPTGEVTPRRLGRLVAC